jgi:hypothetical protein
MIPLTNFFLATHLSCLIETNWPLGVVRHRPGPEWGTWGDPQELNWFLPFIKPLSRTRTLRDPSQTQVYSKQVWLDTTFILQGSQSWGKLVVKTWRVKKELIIITILLIIITTISILNLSFKTIAPKILAHTKCINKYWKYTQIFAATKSSKIIKYWCLPKIFANTQNIGASWKFRRNPKILALHENSGGISKYWRFMKIQAEPQNIGASWKFRRNCKIHAPHNIRWN